MKEALCYQGLAWRSTSLNHHQPVALCKRSLLFLLGNEWLLCLVLVCCRGDLWRLLTHLTSRDGHKKPLSLRNGTRMQRHTRLREPAAYRFRGLEYLLYGRKRGIAIRCSIVPWTLARLFWPRISFSQFRFLIGFPF